MKWENINNAQMRRREAKQKQEEVQLNWIKSSINEKWYEDTSDWSQASTSLEKEEQIIDSMKIEGEETPSMYKNYIYREKNWECPICSAEDHCGHYYYIQYQGIHPKDRSYRMRPNHQCKCLKPSGSNSRKGEKAY